MKKLGDKVKIGIIRNVSKLLLKMERDDLLCYREIGDKMDEEFEDAAKRSRSKEEFEWNLSVVPELVELYKKVHGEALAKIKIDRLIEKYFSEVES